LRERATYVSLLGMSSPRNEVPDPYKLIMSPQADEDLRRKIHSARLAGAVMSFIHNELLHDPGDYKAPLYGSLKGAYVARQKKFGIIYYIYEEVRAIEVLQIYLK
jgi:mRNA-degrading endonuclease RelE of RelBE toxin-antitoxin system